MSKIIPQTSTLASPDQVGVVLVRPQQPGNIGTVARAIANHGLGRLTLVSPQGFDPDRARWMAPEAHHIIDGARFVGTVSEAVSSATVVLGTSARRRRWDWPIVSPTEIAEFVGNRQAVVLFGPEDAGLSNADLAKCHAIISIPTTQHQSLNLGQAVTVIAAAIRAQQAVGSAPPSDDATVEMQSAAVDMLLEILESSDYLRGRSEEQVQGTLFRLLARARPSQKEIVALLGMLGKIRRQVRNTQ